VQYVPILEFVGNITGVTNTAYNKESKIFYQT